MGHRARAQHHPAVPLRVVLDQTRLQPRGLGDDRVGVHRRDAAHDARRQSAERDRRQARPRQARLHSHVSAVSAAQRADVSHSPGAILTADGRDVHADRESLARGGGRDGRVSFARAVLSRDRGSSADALSHARRTGDVLGRSRQADHAVVGRLLRQRPRHSRVRPRVGARGHQRDRRAGRGPDAEGSLGRRPRHVSPRTRGGRALLPVPAGAARPAVSARRRAGLGADRAGVRRRLGRRLSDAREPAHVGLRGGHARARENGRVQPPVLGHVARRSIGRSTANRRSSSPR